MKCINIHHVGLWVNDLDETITFFTDIMGFRLLTRMSRGSAGAGERVLMQIDDRQLIELLNEPHVQLRPDFPIHPVDHVAGIPHLCFRVSDLPAWREKLQVLGYSISSQNPEAGFATTPVGSMRLISFEGPGGVGIELFEFEEEYSFDKLFHLETG